MKVPFVNLGAQYQGLREQIIEKFDQISSKGAYILSEEVNDFEESFAKYCQSKYAISVGNGSDALYLILKSLGIGEGDEVITAPNSFVASAWVIANTGAKIVFAEVGEDFNINPKEIEKQISKNTKAIMPVHLTGRIAKMEEINEIADTHGIHVIEDAAQAVGATRKDKKAGSFGIAAGFSLHPLKNLHVHGDGGVITTSDSSIFQLIKKMRNHGLKNRDECEFWGVNSRLDAIQAAIANIKLPYLDNWNSRYRNIAEYYSKNLADICKVPTHESFEKPVYHRYIIQIEDRDALQKHLMEQGIDTKVNYPLPLHLQEAAEKLNYKKGDFPIAEKLCNTILSLPVYPELEDNQVEFVVSAIRKYYKK